MEESVSLDGITLNLIDTAGIRNTNDPVEQIGVNKAKKSLEEADLMVYMVDSSVPLDESDLDIIPLLNPFKTIVLLNKSDLTPVVTKEMVEQYFTDGILPQCITIAAGKKEGLEQFSQLMKEKFFAGEISFDEEIMISNMRQKDLLVQTLSHMEMVKRSLEDDMPEDFYSIDLMNAYEALGSITGETIGDDLVNEIFSKFCMGK